MRGSGVALKPGSALMARAHGPSRPVEAAERPAPGAVRKIGAGGRRCGGAPAVDRGEAADRGEAVAAAKSGREVARRGTGDQGWARGEDVGAGAREAALAELRGAETVVGVAVISRDGQLLGRAGNIGKGGA